MRKTPVEEAVEELTLILMYLTRFNEEVVPGIEIDRTWKGYDFDVMNALDVNEYIQQGSYRSKSVTISEEGLHQAQRLLKKYQIDDFD